MKRPPFNEKTEVKFINPHSRFYGKRGKVAEIVGFDKDGNILEPPYSKENYPVSWDVHVSVDGAYDVSCLHWEDQLEAVQKKFVDIDYIRETDLVIGKKSNGEDAIRPKNVGAFEPGDIIQITTKIDGANASIAWDEASQSLEIFSRTNLLTSPGSLRGFYDYIKTVVEPKADWKDYKEYVIFGEWEVPHTCKYNQDVYNKWYVYDIWNKSAQCYCSQEFVKMICQKLGLTYIEELYYGPFISWDHCRSFIGKSTAYGPQQEGVVIKNQTKLYAPNPDGPVYIKIVDEKFKESMHSAKEKKPVDPVVEAAKVEASKLASTIVTEARVRKLILKLVDEGKLPAELKPKDMGAVMKLLPKMCFDDCLKEEPETVKQLGEYAGKCISAETAKQARKIVVGG